MIRCVALLWLAGCPLVGKDAYEQKLDEDGDQADNVLFGGQDCDDRNELVHPGAEEIVGNNVDEDCDGTVLCWPDGDYDGWYVEGRPAVDLNECPSPAPRPGDCDDADRDVHPEAAEDLGEDLDCDGLAQCYPDADGDQHGPAGAALEDLDPADCALVADDCDDADPAVHPDQEEVVGNDVDEDCADGALCPDGDADEDTVCDSVDTCPLVDDGVDDDGDGIAAACDGDDGDTDRDDDGLEDDAEDLDLDGVLDPDETDPGDPDSDGDGICDGLRDDAEGDGLDVADACHQRWFVDGALGASGDGRSWATAFQSFADLAQDLDGRSGDEVWVARGVYAEGGQDFVLEVTADFAWYGGFAAGDATFEDRDPTTKVTTLDGLGTTYHVVRMSNGTLDGFRVVGGNAPGPSPSTPGEGAGLLSVGTADVVRNTFFEGNEAVAGSHVDVAPSARLLVEGCAFVGGPRIAVHAVGGLTMRDSVVLGAEAVGIQVEANGSASLYLVDVQGSGTTGLATAGAATVVSSTFYAQGGAGVAVTGNRDVTLSSVTFLGNASAVSATGTGMVRLENAALWGNGAGAGLSGTVTSQSVCAPGATGVGAVTLSANPFDVPTVPADQPQPVYLAVGSPCLDAGNDALATTAFAPFGGTWSAMSTVQGVPGDAGRVDLGRHYASPP